MAYMESQDKAMAKTLGETGGLGTVATRADIIEKLFSSFLLEKKGKDILLTSKARQLLELVPEDLKKPELTADWEMKLSRIARGELSRTRVHDRDPQLFGGADRRDPDGARESSAMTT